MTISHSGLLFLGHPECSVTIAAFAAPAELSLQTEPTKSLGHSPSSRSWTLACSHSAV